MKITVQEVMTGSSVKFGTSGARGLADKITDYVCYVYTKGFLQHLETFGELRPETEIAIAGDFRPSTDRIMQAIHRTAREMGYSPLNCGKIPSPAVALYGIINQIPSIMVTGSHIPADRNGIKFNKSSGEILKIDEEAIRKQAVDVPAGLFDEEGYFTELNSEEWPVSQTARDMYIARYLDIFPADCLKNKKIGVYQHSAVGRDLILDIMKKLGATATPFGRSDEFIPVDTEAIRPEDVELAAQWSAEYGFDSIISTDGDSDRPLISDENGKWLRGDVAGILCAQYLGADVVSTPVSCNSAVEKSGLFKSVNRTRIGSPFVIASMNEAIEKGAEAAVGYEANGGFLINSDITLFDKLLRALPTRDAVIIHLSILLLSVKEGKTISELVSSLPERYTFSDRLKNFPREKSNKILELFTTGDSEQDKTKASAVFGSLSGVCTAIDWTDGIRMTFNNQEVIHLRPSGNAPEFRCYNEADSEERAVMLNGECMKILTGLKSN